MSHTHLLGNCWACGRELGSSRTVIDGLAFHSFCVPGWSPTFQSIAPAAMTCNDPEHKMLIEGCFNLTVRAEKAERERDEWRDRSDYFQRQRAELFDELRGRPCEQIRHKEQVEELRRNLDDVCALYERDCTGVVDSRVALIRKRNKA